MQIPLWEFLCSVFLHHSHWNTQTMDVNRRVILNTFTHSVNELLADVKDELFLWLHYNMLKKNWLDRGPDIA